MVYFFNYYCFCSCGFLFNNFSLYFKNSSFPSIPTLLQICNAFDMSLSDFFREERDILDNDEKVVVNKFRKLDKRDQKNIIKFIDIMNNEQ